MSSRLTSMLLVSVAVLLPLFAAGHAFADKPGPTPKRVSTEKTKADDPPKAVHAPAKPHAAPAAKPAPKPRPADATPAKPDAPGEASSADAAHSGSPTHKVVERESRIEFDERMVKGQTAAGAIYLFQRSPTEFKSIVQVPETFRPRTVEMLTSRRGAP
jgi:hypothetical protein